MKKIICTVFAFLACTSAHAQEEQFKLSEPQLWETLYYGNHSLGHKMVLSRPIKETNDDILSLVMLNYLMYREGRGEALDFFKQLDLVIEHHYISSIK